MLVITTLARSETGGGVRLSAASTAQAFFEAIYSENSYQVIVVDDRQDWPDWKSVVAICTQEPPQRCWPCWRHRSGPEQHDAVLGEGITVVFFLPTQQCRDDRAVAPRG